MDGYGINPMEKFEDITIDITFKNHHTWGYQIYVSGAILQGKKSVIPKWETLSRTGIYLGTSPFHAGSVGLVLKPETAHVSPQFYAVFDDKFSIVLFLREGTITLN